MVAARRILNGEGQLLTRVAAPSSVNSTSTPTSSKIQPPNSPISYADSTRLTTAQAEAAGSAGTPIKFGTQTPRSVITAYQRAAAQRAVSAQDLPSQYVPQMSTGVTIDPAALARNIEMQTRDTRMYSDAQIRRMLEAGQARDAATEREEKTGESEDGLGPDFNGEQQSRDASASAEFLRDGERTPVPGDTPEADKTLGWLALAALAYFTLGV